jgi:predicted ferric reductase
LQPKPNSGDLIRLILLIVGVGGVFGVLFILVALGATPAGATAARGLSSFLALDTVQAWWYVTRAAGLLAYLLTWWSTVWGLGLASRIFHPAVEGAQSYDFHEFVSLLALAFMLLHVGVLMLDRFLPFTLAQLLIPFISKYRPAWVGLGVIGLYTFTLVTVTFYLRRFIGTQAFRSIHVLSLIGYAGVTLHGLFAGTDSGLPAAKFMYSGTFLGVVFLLVYWLVMNAHAKRVRVEAAETRLVAQAQRSGSSRTRRRAA